MTTLSVVIAVKNEASYLPLAVQSILNQTFKDFELIVIDDNSTDGTFEYLTSLSDPRVIVKRNRGVGQTAGLNHGLSLAKSQWIVRMDGDDWCAPDRFEKQWALAQSRPGVVMITSDYIICDESLSDVATIRLTNDQASLFAYLKNRNNPFCHPTVLFRNDAAPGGYDERLKNAQDMDLYKRLITKGAWAHVPEPLVKYRVRKQSLSILRHPEQEQERQMNLSGQKIETVAPAFAGKRMADGLYAYKLGFAAWVADRRFPAWGYLLRAVVNGVRPVRAVTLIALSLLPRSLYLSLAGYRNIYQ
jgi:glycosyltransferase involved in cell wall biosynthesis